MSNLITAQAHVRKDCVHETKYAGTEITEISFLCRERVHPVLPQYITAEMKERLFVTFLIWRTEHVRRYRSVRDIVLVSERWPIDVARKRFDYRWQMLHKLMPNNFVHIIILWQGSTYNDRRENHIRCLGSKLIGFRSLFSDQFFPTHVCLTSKTGDEKRTTEKSRQ